MYRDERPEKLLLLLDPNTFEVEPQHPQTAIDRITVEEAREVWKSNMLQGISAFHEIFGPAGTGDRLEELIEALCSSFPDEDYLQGHRWTTDRILEAQRKGIRESTARPKQDTIPPKTRINYKYFP